MLFFLIALVFLVILFGIIWLFVIDVKFGVIALVCLLIMFSLLLLLMRFKNKKRGEREVQEFLLHLNELKTNDPQQIYSELLMSYGNDQTRALNAIQGINIKFRGSKKQGEEELMLVLKTMGIQKQH